MSSKIWPSHLFYPNLPVNEDQGDIKHKGSSQKIGVFRTLSLREGWGGVLNFLKCVFDLKNYPFNEN